MTKEIQLPDVYRGVAISLVAALDTEIPGNWPEGEKLLEASQPRAIGRVLVDTAPHHHLRTARIAYLFKEKMTRRGQVTLGKAGRASSQLTFLADVDFVLLFNLTTWKLLTSEQRIALVDHELCHCERDLEAGTWIPRHHDVEEFRSIVQRWGLWHPPLAEFGRAVAQADLFQAAPVGT